MPSPGRTPSAATSFLDCSSDVEEDPIESPDAVPLGKRSDVRRPNRAHREPGSVPPENHPAPVGERLPEPAAQQPINSDLSRLAGQGASTQPGQVMS